jgi:hypothetical protein
MKFHRQRLLAQPAGLEAAKYTSLRSHLSNTSGRMPVSEVASELNGLICASVSMARYVTFFYAQLNLLCATQRRDSSFPVCQCRS